MVKFERKEKEKDTIELDDNYYAIAKLLQEMTKILRDLR